MAVVNVNVIVIVVEAGQRPDNEAFCRGKNGRTDHDHEFYLRQNGNMTLMVEQVLRRPKAKQEGASQGEEKRLL